MPSSLLTRRRKLIDQMNFGVSAALTILLSLWNVSLVGTTASIESCPAFNVQLLGGQTYFDGAVFLEDEDGEWHRLCLAWNADVLDHSGVKGVTRIAEVICRQIGFQQIKPSAIFYRHDSAELLRNKTNFVSLFSLTCGGYENHLSECHPNHQNFKDLQNDISNERKKECYYGISCQDDPRFTLSLMESEKIRAITNTLNASGSLSSAGLLNATVFGRTGHVCAGWSDVENRARIAQVACRQMGYQSGVGIRVFEPREHRYVTAHRPFGYYVLNEACLMPDTTCDGRESSVTECDHHQTWGPFTTLAQDETLFPGYDVPLACLSSLKGAFQLRTARQLDNSNALPDEVFVRYGNTWLPVIGNSTSYVCKAICRALYKDRPTKALCSEKRLVDHVVVEQDRYGASIFCRSDEYDVEHCAHVVHLIGSNVAVSHLMASCTLATDVGSTSDPLRLRIDASPNANASPNATSGCLEVSLNGEDYDCAGTQTLDEAPKLALMACKQTFPGRNVTAAFAAPRNFFSSYLGGDVNDGVPITANLGCGVAFAQVGCGSDDQSEVGCVYRQLIGLRTATDCLAVVCARGQVRLSGTSSVLGNDFRLELTYDNTRVFVSADGWNDIAARVACRQLGFGNRMARAIRKVLSHKANEWIMSDVICSGSEKSLTECQHKLRSITVAFGSQVAGVVCESHTQGYPIKVTLSDRPPHGAVQIQKAETATYFCLDAIYRDQSAEAAQPASDIVLCRAAGHTRAKSAVRVAFSVDNATLSTINAKAYKNFICKNRASPLEECAHDGAVDLSECPRLGLDDHALPQLLALRCDNFEFGTMVRLVGGATPFEGHVEVMYKGIWGAVCDDEFDVIASTVICKQIFGQNSYGKSLPGSKFAKRNERFLLDEVRCSFGSRTLSECTHNAWGEHDCGPCEQAGVKCTETPFIRQPTAKLIMNQTSMSLLCEAEGYPAPSYQWFTSGSVVFGVGEIVDVQCHGNEAITYTCNAFNDAGEMFVGISIDRNVGCSMDTAVSETLYRPLSEPLAGITAMAAGVCVLSIALVGLIAYVMWFHIVQQKKKHSGDNENNSSNLSLSKLNLAANEVLAE